MMACASVQVWQNDGLPAQICNKCSAKLHIAFQFKKQCEKSDAKLRQMLLNLTAEKQEQMQPEIQQSQSEQLQDNKIDTVNMPHQLAVQQDNCVYIECNNIMDQISQQQNAFVPVSQTQQPPLTHHNYNQHQQHNQLHLGYNIQGVGAVQPVQVYNATYAMPLQQMQPTNILHNQGVAQMQMQPQIQQLEPLIQQPPPAPIVADDKDKTKLAKTPKRDSKEETGKQCPTCNKIFSTTTKLSRHIKTHSSDLPYKCKVCNKAFAHSGNFKIHLRSHTDERPFKCIICNKGCRQAQDLEKHVRTHTGEKPHKCHICPRAFSTSSNLIAHIRTHTGERPYVCCVCQKAFCQSNELTKHMRTHTGEKSHICDICNKGFNGSSTLIVHRRSHTGERPYVCLVCNKGFAQSSCLAVHMKRHKQGKNFTCTECECQFATASELKDHMTTHDELKTFQCNVCGESFVTLIDCAKHQRTHSNEES